MGRDGTFTYSEMYFRAMHLKHGDKAVQKIGKAAFKKLLVIPLRTDDEVADFLAQHKEILVITIAHNFHPEYIKIRSVVISIEDRHVLEHKYIYVMECIPKEHKLRALGGFCSEVLFDTGRSRYFEDGEISYFDDEITTYNNRHWVVPKAQLRKDYFDEKLHVFLREQEKQHINEISTEDPMALLAGCFKSIDISAVPVDKLTRGINHRGEMLIQFRQISSLDITAQEKKQKLEDLFDKSWYDTKRGKDIFHFSDVIGFNLLAFGAMASKRDANTLNWLKICEIDMAKFRLKTYYGKEESVLNLLKTYNLESKFKKVNLDAVTRAECNRIFQEAFPDNDLPIHWYQAHYTDCALSWAGLFCVISKGICYLSYKHLQMHAFPQLIQKEVEALYCNKQLALGLQDLYLNNKEEPFWEPIFQGCRKPFLEIRKIINEHKSSVVLNGSVVDIEECANTNMFPPCFYMNTLLLKKKNHLYHESRMNWTDLMLSIGFKQEQINDLAYKSGYKEVMSREKFNKKLGDMANRKKDRLPPFGKFCRTLSDTEYVESKSRIGDPMGCPFAILSKDDIKILLLHMGITDKTKVTAFAEKVRRDEPRIACVEVFKMIHGQEPKQEFKVTTRPENYFKASLAVKMEKIEREVVSKPWNTFVDDDWMAACEEAYLNHCKPNELGITLKNPINLVEPVDENQLWVEAHEAAMLAHEERTQQYIQKKQGDPELEAALQLSLQNNNIDSDNSVSYSPKRRRITPTPIVECKVGKLCIICHGPLKFEWTRNGNTFCDGECYGFWLANHPDVIGCNCPPGNGMNKSHNHCDESGIGNTHLDTCLGYVTNNSRISAQPFFVKPER